MNRNTWIIIIVAVIVIIGLIWIFNRGASTHPAVPDRPTGLYETDPHVWKDAKTGCEYVGISGQLTPRIDSQGKPICTTSGG